MTAEKKIETRRANANGLVSTCLHWWQIDSSYCLFMNVLKIRFIKDVSTAE